MTDYVIVFNMYLKIYVTRQFQPKIYLAWHFVRHSKKVIIVSGVHMCAYMHVRVCMHVCVCLCAFGWWVFVFMHVRVCALGLKKCNSSIQVFS